MLTISQFNVRNIFVSDFKVSQFDTAPAPEPLTASNFANLCIKYKKKVQLILKV
jgi:hypothetical protein